MTILYRAGAPRAIARGLAISAFLLLSPAWGGSFKVLHTFCSEKACADGAGPGGLMEDQAGNIFGVALDGGNNNAGVAFELTPKRTRAYDYKVIYTFCAQNACADGVGPYGAPIIDSSGNLYGTAAEGGTYQSGTVYELSPANGQWTLKVLYNFCSQQNCTDGDNPGTGLTYAGAATGTPYDGTSPLYGTTLGGEAAIGAVLFTH